MTTYNDLGIDFTITKYKDEEDEADEVLLFWFSLLFFSPTRVFAAKTVYFHGNQTRKRKLS